MNAKATNPTTNITADVCYGHINMRKSQDWTDAEHTIRTLNEAHSDPAMWFFDVLHAPNQAEAAEVIARHSYDLIHELCPTLMETRIVIGTAQRQNERPAKQVMIGIAAKLKPGDILETIGLADGRVGLWVGGERK